MENVDQKMALTLCCAVIQAYRAFDGNPIEPPAGYEKIAEWTALDLFSDDQGADRVFGLVFNAENDPKRLLFAFRGTKTNREALEAIRTRLVPFVPFEPGREVPEDVLVAVGWMDQYKNMQRKLFDLIDQYEPTDIYLAGHSLGGTLSTLFNVDMALCRPGYPTTLYTIGAPRVGLRGFVDFYNDVIKPGTTIRISNYWDWAPCYPTKFQVPGYQHTTPWTPLCFYSEWMTEWGPGQAGHWVDNYYKALCREAGEQGCGCKLQGHDIGPLKYEPNRAEEGCSRLTEDVSEEGQRRLWDEVKGHLA